MASQYTKKDKILGITCWAGYMLSAPIRMFEYFPREPVSNPFEDGINPRTFIEEIRKRRIKGICLESTISLEQ